MSREDAYQIALIGSGLLVTALLAGFFYREISPEYKIYQKDYIELEAFRSTYTDQPPPDFKIGIKQIVLEREDKGPAVIDRCTSCHVALQIPYFSPTKIAYDSSGKAIQVPNDDYFWDKLDQKIADLKAANDPEAAKYEALKTAHVGDQVYDLKKVLVMHPLIGSETRPFEFHPIEEYGCTSCHNGNGRGLTTDKAHGPVFDGQYEEEFMGPVPKFTERDPANDPKFSTVFNHKPGHQLLFQTEPIFVGALIQAKCMQCHKVTDSTPPTEVDLLTQNYQRGGELFVSQACYACHRINGLARGGIGPELTKAGSYYPWFLKESIIWPQADVKDSTMPNMRLDPAEVEDLMTFLLAQNGQTKAISQIDYKNAVQAWEAGSKQPWEKPITSSQIYDLTYAKTIFATEGCAACHRLNGFESAVGFTIEKSKPTAEQLYDEKEWFKTLFPELTFGGRYNEMPPGSELVESIEKHAEEIDRRISADIRKKGLIEEIDQQYPEVIESFYSNFRYASRAKDDAAWRDRVHKVLMTYIQVYGLGRMIGPNLNWSGVYRSDEWLMEHFRNPAGHVPRSIMPVMPFDDTKFYALTNLLDHMGILNRNAQRKVWETHGFSPAKAFEVHCAQCHGMNLIGNGPVSEWIYPIPKNLRNSDFLKNLTKQKAIDSILHGVKGTPMAPWGEVAKGKPSDIQKELDDKPVLTKAEIEVLVDWIYSSISIDHLNIEPSNILKWNYKPEDVIKELKNEKGHLDSIKEVPKVSFIQGQEHRIFASFIPFLAQNSIPELAVDDLFDQKSDPLSNENSTLFYIKQKYYTPYNIEEGRKLFLLNCSVCHGTEADGSGVRAQTMRDAKPRMLTNLDWVNSHDDLRLLRSIKYGVPGTSMTPWGDVTSSQQRLQMVIFIRSLSDEKEKKEALDKAIYHTFDEAIFTVDKAGVKVQQGYDTTNAKANALKDALKALEDQTDNAIEIQEKGVSTYKQILEVEQELKKDEQQRKVLQDIKILLKKERELYLNLGINLIMKTSQPDILNKYVDLIRLNDGRYKIVDDKLTWNEDAAYFDKIKALQNEIVKEMEKELAEYKREESAISGKIASEEQKQEIEAKEAEIKAYQNVIDKVKNDIDTAIGLAKKQQELVKKDKLQSKRDNDFNDLKDINDLKDFKDEKGP